jgi:hypothetical protein
MTKKILMLVSLAVPALMAASCMYEVMGRNPYYYDYDDKSVRNTTSTSSYAPFYPYSFSYSNTQVSSSYTPDFVPTPLPALVPASGQITVLKVINNNYYFYSGNTEIAVWTFNNDGTVKKAGRPINGLVRRYYEGTQWVESEIMYRDNERWGESRKFSPDGKIKERVYYKGSERDGDYYLYFPNGRVAEHDRYSNGKKSGKYKMYGENGEVAEKGVYQDGNKQTSYTNKNIPAWKAGVQPANIGASAPVMTNGNVVNNESHFSPIGGNNNGGNNQRQWGNNQANPVMPAAATVIPYHRENRVVNQAVVVTVAATATPVPTAPAARATAVITVAVAATPAPTAPAVITAVATPVPVMPAQTPAIAPGTAQTAEPTAESRVNKHNKWSDRNNNSRVQGQPQAQGQAQVRNQNQVEVQNPVHERADNKDNGRNQDMGQSKDKGNDAKVQDNNGNTVDAGDNPTPDDSTGQHGHGTTNTNQ